jgi:hypothetical protein
MGHHDTTAGQPYEREWAAFIAAIAGRGDRARTNIADGLRAALKVGLRD